MVKGAAEGRVRHSHGGGSAVIIDRITTLSHWRAGHHAAIAESRREKEGKRQC